MAERRVRPLMPFITVNSRKCMWLSWADGYFATPKVTRTESLSSDLTLSENTKVVRSTDWLQSRRPPRYNLTPQTQSRFQAGIKDGSHKSVCAWNTLHVYQFRSESRENHRTFPAWWSKDSIVKICSRSLLYRLLHCI
jgi:hypothetical protein